jgi:hypothetical protein
MECAQNISSPVQQNPIFATLFPIFLPKKSPVAATGFINRNQNPGFCDALTGRYNQATLHVSST